MESFEHQPDLIQFFLPVEFSRLLGPVFADFLRPYNKSPIETAVFLSWTGTLLCFFALLSGNKLARRWLLFTLLCILIALGPDLKVLGRNRFTEYDLPVILPYAFLTALPGFDFWRTPGRFMLIGFIGFGIAASFGLVWLTHHLSHGLRHLVTPVAILLVLAENWPQPWWQEVLRPVPQFYQQIAHDDEQYGVFDLPIRPFQEINYFSWYIYYSSYYQMYQMTHGKGIATGYISRHYNSHPLFSHFVSDSTSGSPLQTDVLVNGQPANRYANVQYELARYGYRYVVYHKPQDWYSGYKKGSWGELTAREFIKEVFGQQAPLVDDELVQVYEVAPPADTTTLTTTIALREPGKNVRTEAQTESLWAISPATFYVASPHLTPAWLAVESTSIKDQSDLPHERGILTLHSSSGFSISAVMTTDRTTTVPFMLLEGSHILTLTLQAENFQVASDAPEYLDFAIGTINLQTLDSSSLLADIPVEGVTTVPPVRYPLTMNFDHQVEFLGYDLEETNLGPGDTLHLTLYWRALAEMDKSYTVFTHLLDSDSRIRGQKDSAPGDGTLPTTSWVAGEIIADRYEIAVHSDAQLGRYVLEIGFYDADTGQRLPVISQEGQWLDDRVLLPTGITLE